MVTGTTIHGHKDDVVNQIGFRVIEYWASNTTFTAIGIYVVGWMV
jgi:hypothetical protein